MNLKFACDSEAGDHFGRVSELLSENEQKWIKFTGAPGLTVRL